MVAHLNPYELHLLIAANNPTAVAANLAAKGVIIPNTAQPDQLVLAAYQLEKGNHQQFVLDLMDIFGVEVIASNPNADQLENLSLCGLQSLVMHNALANPAAPQQLVDSQEYELLKQHSEERTWAIYALIGFGLIALIYLFFRR